MDHFSASQIAAAIGRSARIVRRWLAGVAPAGQRIVRGNATIVWNFESLPASIRKQLVSVAQQRGFRSVADLLNGPDLWHPEIPWNELCAEQQAEALKLQRALASACGHWSERINSSAALGYDWREDPSLQSLGLRAYEVEYGHPIASDRWKYLFERTLDRDRGAGQFHRPELFLSGNLKCKAPMPTLAGDADFEPLNLCICNFGDPLNPTTSEIDMLWHETVRLFYKLIEVRNYKKAKRQMLDFLWRRASFLAKSPNALRVNLDRKLKLGDNPRAFVDGRVERCGVHTAKPYDPEQIALIKVTASNLDGGRRAQAVRELNEKGLITDPRIKLALDRQTSKSALPASLRAELKDVPAWQAFHLGDRAAKKMVPTRKLTYDGIFSMTCLVGDDGTPNNYVAVPNVQGEFDAIRPQLLIISDFRTDFIVSWATVPRPQYRASDVVAAFKRALRKFGLPKFILREGGIWRKSNAVNALSNIGRGSGVNASQARPRSGAPALTYSPAEIQFGLERMDIAVCSTMDDLVDRLSSISIQFRESYRPNSKPVEGVIRRLWDMMDKLPCFCGRSEKIDCPESTRRAVELVSCGKAQPHEVEMLLWDEWVKAVDATVAKYNSTVQEGEKTRNALNGEPLSPEDAFHIFENHTDPPRGFNSDCEILLSRAPIKVEVKLPNIRRRSYPCGFVKIMGHTYCDEQTGRRMGQKLLAFFDPEFPESCMFTDVNMRNPFTVPRLEPTNALFPDDQTAITAAQAHRTIAAVKATYKAAVTRYEPLVRQTLVPYAVKHLTDHVNETAKAISEKNRQRNQRAATMLQHARKLGLPTALVRPDDESQHQAFEKMEKARRALEESEPKGESK